jgi:hypothetical protein
LAGILARCKLSADKGLQLEAPAMKQFQKIAIGLLGLTHPEMFIPRPKPSVTSTTKTELPHGRGAPEPLGEGPGARAMRALKFMVAALGHWFAQGSTRG